MSTQPKLPGPIEEIDEDLKRLLDERLEDARKNPERVSHEEWARKRLANLNHPVQH